MASQQQDLVFFTDGSLLSFEKGSKRPQLHIISYRDGTAPMWLVTSLVENCLVGTANQVNRDLKSEAKDCSVLYVSFSTTEDSFKKACTKQAVDIDSLSLFEYLDYSTSLFTTEFVPSKDPSTQCEKLFSNIASKLKSKNTVHKVVFIESPELLLAATDLPSNELLAGIRGLNEFATVIPIINVHNSNYDLESSNGQDPTFRSSDFFVKLFHSSSLNVQLQPLSTGKAKDITGSLTVTRGALPGPTNLEVLEREYVFQVTKDATAKLFFR